MEKMWAGRTAGALNQVADDFNSSIAVDSRMAAEDIRGSMAHAAMLGATGIISPAESAEIIDALGGILSDMQTGKLAIDPAAEDIHMFVETVLTDRIGDAGKKLHTARSRNDQVATDTRLYLRGHAEKIITQIRAFITVLTDRAEENKAVILPGYTHLQRAQPVTFGHHLMAYSAMLMRDIGRFSDAASRMNECPLGAAALAGTTYPIHRGMTAQALGFTGVCQNSIDAVSDRDFCVELESAAALLMAHLSRFAEELILWTSWEFRFVELTDAFTTGSSIMPQKKNSDMAELIRGKTGRVYGDLIATLTMLKGLPLAYDKDMQEDKEAVFDALDTAEACLAVLCPMVKTMRVNRENMLAAAQKGFLNATDLADYLTKKGMPFRSAYKTVGAIVAACVKKGITLDDMALADYQKYSDLFAGDLYAEISLETCVAKRISEGGTSVSSVEKQIGLVRGFLAK